MKPYPDTIGPRELAKAASISDAIVASDITETEAELEWMRRTGQPESEINLLVAYVDYLKRLQVARRALYATT